jgi:hypothetical protein
VSAPRAPRCRDRAAAWQADVSRHAVRLMAACPADADAIAERLELQIQEGPDFTRCRRGSDFRQPPKVNTDRNFLARLMFMADMIERKSWRGRPKGKHGGALGRSALTLLRVLLFIVNKKGGYLAPSYDTLARLGRMSRRTVVTAMGVLEAMGFVTVHRRIKRVHTPFGVKVVQDANAYEYQLPKGLGAIAWSFFGPPASECKNTPARNTDRKKEGTSEKVGWQRVREWREARHREGMHPPRLLEALSPVTWMRCGQARRRLHDDLAIRAASECSAMT